MNRRITLTLGAAATGLLGAAFLPVAVAFADTYDPFTDFAGMVHSTVSTTEVSNLDAALNANPELAAILANDVSMGSYSPSEYAPAPLADDAFANLIPAADASNPADQYLFNEAAEYDGVLFKLDPTLAATLAADDSTGTFPDAPGADAFSVGGVTLDPFYTNASGATTEGFEPVTQVTGTGTPPFFDTGVVNGQSFEVFGTASGSTAPAELGTITASEDVTNLFGITNTGLDVTSGTPVGSATLPADGTVYDVTNFGSGFDNVYTDVPGAAGTTAAGSVTDTLVTPFGNFDLSSLVSALDLTTSLDPGAAFGVGTDAAGAAADAVSGVDPLAFLGL